jgi:hypothetical protein
MQRIELSEMTNRLHRNAIGSAALIISIKFFSLQIDKAGTLGIEIKNFTTSTLVIILAIALLYHGIGFTIRALEEYRIWELELTSKQGAAYGGGFVVVDLADRLRSVGESLQKITENTGAITSTGQTIFTKQDADKLIEVSRTAEVYGRRLKNFPWITRVRFWGWDIGITAATTIIAILFAWSLLPSGHQLFCGL